MIKKILSFGIVALMLSTTGCRVLTYESVTPEHDGQPSINRKVTYATFGLNTEMEGLNIVTPQGSMGIAKHGSDASRAMDTLDNAISKIPSPVSQVTKTTVQPSQLQPSTVKVPVAPKK